MPAHQAGIVRRETQASQAQRIAFREISRNRACQERGHALEGPAVTAQGDIRLGEQKFVRVERHQHDQTVFLGIPVQQ